MTTTVRARPAPAPDRAPRPAPGRLSRALHAGGLVLAGLAAGLGATVAGPLGTKALAAAGAIAVVIGAAYVLRRPLAPLLPGRSLPASAPDTAAPAPRRSRLVGLVLLVLLGSVAGTLAFLAGMLGTKGLILLLGLVIGGSIAVLYRRELAVVLVGPRTGAKPDWAPEPLLDLSRGGKRDAGPPQLSKPLLLLVSLLAVGGAILVAWLAASLGLKGPLAVVGGIALVLFALYVRPKADVVLFLVPCSMVLFLHKSFSDFTLVNSGAPAIYITSLGAITLLLYGLWASEGSLGADLRATLRRPIVWAPLVGALTFLPSLVVAVNLTLSVAELVRMAWMYLLYVYLAARVRRRGQILLVVAGLGILACVELVVTVLQWKTGGVLGLAFLGVPTQLGERVINDGSIGRPFGTIVHPVFLGAAMGMLALLFLSLGLHVRERQAKVALLGLVPVSLVPILLAQSRAALMAFAPVALGVVIAAAIQRRVTARALRRCAVVGLVAGVALFPTLKAKYDDNFGTNHFSVEVESRVQLNELAYQMIDDHPIIGVGLNNFQQVQPRYDNYGLLFAGNPVHNLYLLQLAETGWVGLLGLLLVGGSLLVVSVRLARERDPLFSGMGTAMAAVIAFFAIEELLGFSLRQEIPLALFWLLAGLTVAASAMASIAKRRPPRTLRVAPYPTPRVPTGAGTRPGGGGTGNGTNGHGTNGHGRANGANGNGSNGGSNGNGSNGGSNGHGPTLGGAASNASALERRVHELAVEHRRRVDARLAASRLQAEADAADQLPWLDELVLAFADLTARGAADPAMSSSTPVEVPVAGAASTDGRVGARPRPRRRPRRALAAGLFVAILAGGFSLAAPSVATSTSNLRIVFAATDRKSGDTEQAIFVATGDGAEITRLTPRNGFHYDFPQWAMGGTKIIYSMRMGPFGSAQNIYMMNPDGSGVQALTTSPWRNDQPKVAPDGRTAIFSRFVPGTRLTAIFEIDLATLLTHSLSAEHSRSITADADPRFANEGRNIVFARSRDDVGDHNTQVYRMNRDGTGYTRLTDDPWFDVDPSLSPDGADVATSSYQGEGSPKNDDAPLQAKQEDFRLLVRHLATGVDRNLTRGEHCSLREPTDPCAPDQGSAYTPLWTPDGTEIGYVSALDTIHVCICLVGKDGTGARTVISEPGLSISYFDWIVPTAPPAGAVPAPYGTEAPGDRMLITGNQARSESDPSTTPFLRATTRDGWNQLGLPVPPGLEPRFARWTADRKTMVFSAFVPGAIPPEREPDPAPAGETRHEHFTLDDLKDVFRPQVVRREAAREQVFIATPDGLRQLTDPYIEDWRDGLVPGDARGNTEPDISPDGRYVVMTNVSTKTLESFIIRLDLQTGEVLNLTNATAGAIPTDDAQPRFSPDGRSITFNASVNGKPQVMVMDADGYHVRHLTDDDFFNVAPTWSPDGSTIAYTSFRGNGQLLIDSLLLPEQARRLPLDNWYIVQVDVATGHQQVLTRSADSPALEPTYSPDGRQLAFISITDGLQPDVYVIDADAAATGARPRPNLITVLDQELSVDWK